MFRPNKYQQISFDDVFNDLDEKSKTRLEKSWAKCFGDEIFPLINEENFKCLYSDDDCSCPNSPVNVTVSLLILKELFGLTDEEVIENAIFDIRYKYALHTTSCKTLPSSKRTLERFRERLVKYDDANNTDLFKNFIIEFSQKISEMMGLSPNIRRMDSMMIAANIKRLGRYELIYRCISDLVKYLHKSGNDALLEGLEHYLDEKDFNNVTYHDKSKTMEEKTEDLLKDAEILLEKCGEDFVEIEEFQLFVRCIFEQTTVDEKEEKRRLKTKEDGEMNSQMLQSPVDPEATYRVKAGNENIGYCANFEETVDKDGSVITYYQVEQNIYSDSQFMEDRLEQLPDKNENEESEKIIEITDGAYAGEKNDELAAKKNVEIITTNLTGKETPDIYGDFELSENGEEIVKCPAGKTPEKCTNNPKYKTITAKFGTGCCANCPHREKCPAKINKNGTSRVTIKKSSVDRALKQRKMKTKDHSLYYRIRNGAETIMSVMRRKYNIDKIPAVGKLRIRLYIGAKVAAYNFTKLFLFRKGQLCCAQNEIFG